MTLFDVLLLVAAFAVVCASVVVVIRRRHDELQTDASTAADLARIARTLQALRDELSGSEDALRATTTDEFSKLHDEFSGLHIVKTHPDRDAAFEPNVVPTTQWLRFHILGGGAMANRENADSVVNFWEHLTRDAHDGNSYRDLLGPTFDDAIFHASNVGVLDHNQADALRVWAESTAAVTRPSRGKRRAQGPSFVLTPSGITELRG